MIRLVADYFDVFQENIQTNITLSKKQIAKLFLIGIDRNFSGKLIGGEVSSICLKKEFLKEFLNKNRDLTPNDSGEIQEFASMSYNVWELIAENMLDKKSRHMMIFTEKASIDEFVIKRVKEIYEKINDSDTQKVLYFNGSSSRDDAINIMHKLPFFIRNGYVLIMKDLDEVYGCMYDVLNQKVTRYNNKEGSYLFFDEHKTWVEIHKDFK